MKNLFYLFLAIFGFIIPVAGQNDFDYSIEFIPVEIPGLPGLHSYAFGQHEGKWLILGGRTDGLHPRQPFSSFPESHNNTDIYVIDPEQKKFWKASVDLLVQSVREQLQATNMNFYQDKDTLYIIGGYAYSQTAKDHITFPYLCSVNVPATVNSIINNIEIKPYFKQLTHENFAVTGGQLGKIGSSYYLVGGQKFTGRYNPHNNPTFKQEYTHQIRKFKINNSEDNLIFSDYDAISDELHLRRRDYNLLPQIFPDGQQGYTISSGVFQPDTDLPFLYPVDIRKDGYFPVTTFNQYLSNYHSAKASLYDSTENIMYNLFFGGMSQYYYENGNLIRDDLVPFVRTVSLVKRFPDGSLNEYKLPIEMPGLKGASAEFIPAKNMPHYASEIIKLDKVNENEFIIGHIYGGINSTLLNPFSNNLTDLTNADNSVFAVKLTRRSTSSRSDLIDGANPYQLSLFPNPVEYALTVQLEPVPSKVRYYLSNRKGMIVKRGSIMSQEFTGNEIMISLEGIDDMFLIATFVLDDIFYLSEKFIKNK